MQRLVAILDTFLVAVRHEAARGAVREGLGPLRRHGRRLGVELGGLVVGARPVPLVALALEGVVDVALRHAFLKVRVRVRQVPLEAPEVPRPGAALLVERAPRLHLCQNQPVSCVRSTGQRRVDGVGRLKFDFHTGLHLGVAAEGEGVRLAEFLGRRTVRRAARGTQRVLLPVEAPGYILSNTKFAKHMAARQRHGALAQVLADRAREVRGVVLVA